MRFSEGFFARDAAEAAKPIAMFPKALAFHAASLANHCFSGFCIAHHVKIILLPLVVCQEKSALILPLQGIFVWWSSDLVNHASPRYF
jgi:hypothetical protein